MLRNLLNQTGDRAENAVIDEQQYLRAFGFKGNSCTAGELWSSLLQELRGGNAVLSSLYGPIETIEKHGTLATRIGQALGSGAQADGFSRQDLQRVYGELSDCLTDWKSYLPR